MSALAEECCSVFGGQCRDFRSTGRTLSSERTMLEGSKVRRQIVVFAERFDVSKELFTGNMSQRIREFSAECICAFDRRFEIGRVGLGLCRLLI